MSLLQIHEPGETPAPHEDSAAVGIDLGTTHSVIAIMHDGKPVPIEDAQEYSVIPSVVRYAGSDVIVGRAAREPGREDGIAVASIKRLMGRSYEEALALMPHMTDVLEQAESDPVPRIKTDAGLKTPIDISADILRHLKRMAEQALGKEVTQAVITVPAYFDDTARLATRDAARLAGLEVLRLINEPTAAALAYGLEHAAEGVYAIYDLGGGTFDISFLKLEGGVFQVLSTAGDTALGGDDLDRAIAELVVQSCGGDIDVVLLQRARLAKESLAGRDKAQIKWNGQAFTLTQDGLAGVVLPVVEKTIQICMQAMRDASMSKDQIKGVVLVGGSTRLKSLQEMVGAFFGRTPLSDVDPDRVVAFGAAEQASNLTQGGEHLLLDVIPLSLGLETMGDLAEKIIHRNTPIPVAVSQEFTTYQDGQTGMQIHVLQGEREMASQCRSLAKFNVSGIPPMTAGLARIKVTFQVDADGLLTVSAEETSTGEIQTVQVKPSYGLPIETIEQMLKESMEHARSDMTERLLSEAKVEANRTVMEIRSALEHDGAMLSEEERGHISDTIAALEAACKGDDRDEIDVLHDTLQRVSGPFAQKRMDKAIGDALKGSNIEEI